MTEVNNQQSHSNVPATPVAAVSPATFARIFSTTNLPNLLTLGRVLVVPLFVLLLVDPSPVERMLATILFILAAITDWVDGYLARKFGTVSDLGKLLDPLADKILIMAALIMLVSQRDEIYGEPWVPGWMVVMVLAREMWVTGLRGMAATQGVIVPAGSAGKVKSGLQMVAVVFLLAHGYSEVIWGYQISAQLCGLNLLMLSIVFSYWSAANYTQRVIAGFKTIW